MSDLFTGELNTSKGILNAELSSITKELADKRAEVLRLENRAIDVEAGLARIREYATDNNHPARQELLRQPNSLCPACFAENGAHSRLIPLQGNNDLDIFKCTEFAHFRTLMVSL